MPKNTVTDPITDQEVAFAHLLLSGTMNDQRAAEAAGLSPATAAYTKAKPRVRAYMLEHRAAVREKLVHQEAEGLRTLNLGRDQILARLWELANLNPETTRGSMAGQIKALAMIVAIEGLVTDRGHSPRATPPAALPVGASHAPVADARRPPQQPVNGTVPNEAAAAAHARPAPSQRSEPPAKVADRRHGAASLHPDPPQPGIINPFIHPEPTSHPDPFAVAFDAVLGSALAPGEPSSPGKGWSGISAQRR